MSFNDEYLKLRKKRLAGEETDYQESQSAPRLLYKNKTQALKPPSEVNNDDIAPVRPTTEEEDKKWYQKIFKASEAGGDDGWSAFDVLKATDASTRDIMANVRAGALKGVEGAIDIGATIIGGVGGLFGADGFRDKMSEFVAKDIIDEKKIATEILDPINGGWASNLIYGNKTEDIEANSVFGDTADSAAQTVGDVLMMYAMPTEKLKKLYTFGTAFAGGVENAFKDDATYGEAVVSGGIDGMLATELEKWFGAIGFGGASKADDFVTRNLSKKISNRLLRTGAKLGIDFLGEGTEELVEEVGSRFGRWITYQDEETWQDMFASEEAFDSYAESFFLGGFVGDLFGGAKALGLKADGRDYTTGLTANEEAVFNKVYDDRIATEEENGKKLSSKDKSEIYDKVMNDLKKGYIGIEDIEAALGGDTYMEYKNTIANEDALKKEFDELGALKNTDLTVKQNDRYNELKKLLADAKTNKTKDNLKSRLSKEVQDLLVHKDEKGNTKYADNYLIESYNQDAKRRQVFEADVSKYDAKQQEIVKKAIESRVLNNTRRSHELVDMIAKISADKGVSFDFLNNDKLKESGFAVDGKTVNGYYNKETKTIGVNIEGEKYLDTLVGHEVTHVLEGTEVYTELQKAIFAYAESKGEYASRRKHLESLYKAEDIDSELTADLVGDYLFTDSDFIKNLSVKHRNVFQKIYDEIKYLCKVATAGSKEARELERVKKAFEDAYRESGAKASSEDAKSDVKHSLSDSDGKQLTKEQSEYFKDSKMRDENGNLKVMYHGSQDAGFHVFDSSMSDDDTSFFFVDRNDVAASYSGTSETYEAKTIRTAEDMNKFLAEIGYDQYQAVERNGKFELLENNEHVAYSDTAQGIYDEFCWYEGVGEGDANYKVYLNLTNPLVVDAEGRNWNNVTREFSQELADKYNSLTAEEKEALLQLAAWEDIGMFRDEFNKALVDLESGFYRDEYAKNLARAFNKLGGYDANVYDIFSIASENFSEESIKEFAVKQMNTRDYAQKAKAEGYDGVIFKNIVDVGGYGNGSEGASTVAIAFDSNQIKSVANEKPTGNPDIRYSLSGDSNTVKTLDSGTVTRYSLSTWTPDTQAKVRDNLIKAGYESYKVDKWIKDTNSVASVIAADKDRLDYEAADNQVMLKDNQEYIKTLDASTLCAKRLVYQGTFDAIQHRMPNTMLSSDDLIDLLNMMKEHGVQTPCGVCYVESRRRHLGKFAQDWLNKYNGEYKPNLDELTTSDGLEVLRKSHPQTYKDFVDAMNKKGSSNPKVVQLRTEYRNDIMSLTPSQIRKIEAIGGLRVQSFSDFETPHMLDMMQAVMDMSAKGLHSQAYTKVPNFAWVFGDTGIKINLSLIAEGDGFDVDGNLAFSSTEGMDFEEAMKLRDAYSANVGTIIVGANDKHILACMADDRIDFIIPFHRSGWGMKELEMMGMNSYTDYTYGQKEHDLNKPTKVVNGVQQYEGLENLYPIDYWDYSLTGKENAERYLNLCAKTSREPKFSQFLVNNGDGSYSLQPDGSTDGYWKTLIDFKMYDNNGVGVSQQQVQPNFNMDEAYRVLNEYEGNANTLPVANDVVEEFVARHQSTEELAPAMSISANGEPPYKYGNISGEDVRLVAPTQESVVPIREDVAKNATTTPIVSEEEKVAPEGFAPITEEKANAQQSENIASITDKEAYEAIKPKRTKEPSMKRIDKPSNDIAPTATYETTKSGQIGGQRTMFAEGKTAKVHTEEPKTDKTRRSAWSMVKNNVLDKGMVFEDLSLETGNRELQARWNSIRYAEGKAQKLIGEGNASVSSLNSIRDAVESSGKTQQFYEYLYHMLNVDRMTLDRRYEGATNKAVFGDSVTAEVSQEAANKLEKANPEFKTYAKEVYDYMNYLRGMLVDGGVISSDTAKLWAEMYPHYVPIRRAGDTGLNINVPLDTGRTGVNAPIKKATGGNRDILPLFDTMALRTEQTYKAIAKNRFGVELKNTLGTTIANEETSVDDTINSIEANDELLQKGKNGKNPTFTVFENGKKVTFEITEEMYDAIKPASKGLSYTNKVASTVGNVFRGLLTEYNPVFMATNAVKDVQDVLINSQHAAKTYAAIPKAIKQMSTNGHWYQEYLENGGEQNTYFDNNTNTFKAEDKGIKKLIGMPLRGISYLNNTIERVPRLAEYIASREAGASIDVAMLDAARVTTNFAAGGDLTKALNRNGFTFLNASMQGAMQQVRNVREAKANGLKGWVQLASKVALAGLPALLLNNLLWDDDEEYEELSDYVKDNYYVVAKFGDGKFVRIPKGRTLAVIQDAFEQVGNALTGDDEVDLNNFLDLAISNLAPNNPIENNLLAPVFDVINNETWYGEDLVPTRLQDLPDAEQYDESTDSLSKWLGEKLDYSPYKINYLLNQYSGGLGDVFLPMLTPEAESGDNSLLGNLVAPWKDKFTTDSVMNNQNVSDFYDTVDELTKNAKSSNATDEDVLMYKYMNSINSKLGDLYKQKREIQNSDLDDSEKYEAVRELQEQINSLARNSLNTYGNVRIDGGYATVGNMHYRMKDGTWQKISEDQLEQQEDVVNGLGINPAEYWSNKTEYDFAYEHPEKYAVAKSIGGFEKYKTYSSELYDIKADKDENGKSISGSRKEKVIEYINNLDADYGEKIILFKHEYNADDTYNYDIIDYLNSREDISYEEMETILKELGFDVDSKGNITWD